MKLFLPLHGGDTAFDGLQRDLIPRGSRVSTFLGVGSSIYLVTRALSNTLHGSKKVYWFKEQVSKSYFHPGIIAQFFKPVAFALIEALLAIVAGSYITHHLDALYGVGVSYMLYATVYVIAVAIAVGEVFRSKI